MQSQKGWGKSSFLDSQISLCWKTSPFPISSNLLQVLTWTASAGNSQLCQNTIAAAPPLFSPQIITRFSYWHRPENGSCSVFTNRSAPLCSARPSVGQPALLFTSPSASVAFLHLKLQHSVQDIAQSCVGNCKEQKRTSGGKEAAWREEYKSVLI